MGHRGKADCQQQEIISALISSPVFVPVCMHVWVCLQVLLSTVSECACVRVRVLATRVCWCAGAEVSDCLVSVGSKLWQFALTVNLEEFLMELRSCQTSKCFTFSFLLSLFLPSLLKSSIHNFILSARWVFSGHAW